MNPNPEPEPPKPVSRAEWGAARKRHITLPSLAISAISTI